MEELFDLVQRAQQGDNQAMYEIISSIMPAIRSASAKTKADRQDDLEQDIVETLIKKIKTYDLSHTPDFTEFCNRLIESQAYNSNKEEGLFIKRDNFEMKQ